MHTHTLLGALGLCAVAGAFLTTSKETARNGAAATVTSTPAPQPADYGHLILQIEGDANELAVTHITPKQAGFNPRKIQSPYTVDLLSADGTSLGTYPIDLTAFDLDPARAGAPIRVEGCEVRDSRIAMITSVPFVAATASLRIQKKGQVIGRVAAARLAELIEQGAKR